MIARVPLLVVDVDGRARRLCMAELTRDDAGELRAVLVRASMITTMDDAGETRPIGLRLHEPEARKRGGAHEPPASQQSRKDLER